MTRNMMIGGAQLGPIMRNEPRQVVVSRLLELLREAHGRGCDIVIFPELALTSFFPRWWMEDEREVESFFEREMPSPATLPLFEEAKALGVGFYLGYAETTEEKGETKHYNTAILVDKGGAIVGKYRKVHLPGHADHKPDWPFQHLEKRYFDVGDLGFGTWRTMGGVFGMCICNDRRWPETYRVLALKGAEVVLLGYNTPANMPWEPIYSDLTAFHNHLCMQAGAYQNGAWVVGVAKAGIEEGLRPDRWLHHRRAVGRDRRSGCHQRGRTDRRPLRSGPLRARTGRHVQFRRPSADRALQDHHRTDGGHPAGIGQGRTRLRPPGRPDNSPYHGSQIQIDTPIGRW